MPEKDDACTSFRVMNAQLMLDGATAARRCVEMVSENFHCHMSGTGVCAGHSARSFGRPQGPWAERAQHAQSIQIWRFRGVELGLKPDLPGKDPQG